MRRSITWSRLISVFLLLFIVMVSYAQQISITGTVTGEDGEPLPGVNVLIKGTTAGTVTNLDGLYSIDLDEGATLLFSFVGYLPQEIATGTSTVIDVVLSEDLIGLEEVVVIGYGSVRKRDLTGSVSSVKPRDFNVGLSTAPEQLIQGKVTGVNIIQNSGQPGASTTVRIRGASSISAGNDPLYVIDGVPLQFTTANEDVRSSSSFGAATSPFSTERTNPLNVINPSDIESVEILKDASAAAIYGSRGANGVILITTKDKNVGTSMVTYDAYVGVGYIPNRLPVLSADQYRSYAEDEGLAYPDEGANTDWQDEIFRTALSHNHNVSFSGGNATSSYRASVGYGNQDGTILNSNIKKITTRLNANTQAMDGRLELGLNMTYATTDQNNALISSNIGNESGNILKDAIRWAPTLPVHNADGSYYQIGELRVNPVSWQDITDNRINRMFLGNVTGKFHITEALSIDVNLGSNLEDVERYTAVPEDHPVGETQNGRASSNKIKNFSQMMETNLVYNKQINDDNHLTVLAGYSFQRWEHQYSYMDANNFVSSSTRWDLMQSGDLQSSTSYRTANRLASYYGRINYRLMGKYLVTATLRRDGSSRFGENNRWGLFPSGAVAWNLTEEDFFNVSFIDNLKIRVGYGITGNQEIPNDLWREQLSISGSSVYSFGGIAVPSVLPSNYPNPDLKWEQTAQTNVGLDYAFIGGRISGTIDYYSKYTSDLLLEFSTASPSVVTSQWANVGEVKNTGFEFMIDGKIVKQDDFQWNATFNISTNKNNVEALSNDEFEREEILQYSTSGVVSNGANIQIIRPGLSLGTFYGRKFTGYDGDGLETYLDEDGEDGADLVEIGCALPKIVYGFSNYFYWKGFDASLTFRGVSGVDVYNNTEAEFAYKATTPGVNVLESALSSPASRTQNSEFSSQWIQDGSYFRLDNLSIGYTFNTDDISFISRARVYVTGQNLFVITDYTGYDPEVRTNTNRGNVAPLGIDYLMYPRPRVFTLGASIAF
jgi:iron complex outermembrane receptor protein